MVKILSRASRLKSDDFNLHGKSLNERMCTNCNLALVEDVRHIILQCPFNEPELRKLDVDLRQLQDGSGVYALDSADNLMCLALGQSIQDLSEFQMYNIWEITGQCVVSIYLKVIKQREGIG